MGLGRFLSTSTRARSRGLRLHVDQVRDHSGIPSLIIFVFGTFSWGCLPLYSHLRHGVVLGHQRQMPEWLLLTQLELLPPSPMRRELIATTNEVPHWARSNVSD